jgi:dUTP pyrophosphatase
MPGYPVVQIKKLSENAILPEKKSVGAAAFDMYATEVVMDRFQDCQIVYKTGIAMSIPEGHVGLIYPRSSIRDTFLSLTNAVGVIDSDYRGEITFTFNYRGPLTKMVSGKLGIPIDSKDKIYKSGDRIGQIIVMPIPLVYYKEVQELSPTLRGSQGLGSTGR